MSLISTNFPSWERDEAPHDDILVETLSQRKQKSLDFAGENVIGEPRYVPISSLRGTAIISFNSSFASVEMLGLKIMEDFSKLITSPDNSLNFSRFL